MFRTDLNRLRQLWQPPRTHREAVEDRTVSFLELFYDLVYVVIIAAAAHHLAGHMDWHSVGEFVIVFSLIWIAWLNGMAVYDFHGREDIRTRAFTFVQMLLVVLLAVYVADGKEGRAGFAMVYGLYLVVLAWLWLTAHLRNDERYRRVSRVYLILLLLTIATVVGSAFTAPATQLWIWGAIVLVWIPASFFISRTASVLSEGQTIASDSFVERFGLFTIIVLGEVVVGVVNGIAGAVRNFETLATGLLALSIGFGFWWNYFDLTGRRLPREDRTGLPIWVVLHLPLTMAIAAAGAAMVSVIEHAGDLRTPAVTTWVLSGSVAVALATIAAMVRTLHDWSRYRTLYRPTSILMLILAIGSLLLSLLRPEPIVLVSSLLGLLVLAWFVAVYRWLRTEGQVEP